MRTAPGASPGVDQLRLESARLRLAFLETEIEISFVIAAMAKTNRALGYDEAANRGMAIAHKGFRTAKYLHRTLSHVDAVKLESLAARLDALEEELGSDRLSDWFPEYRTSAEQAVRSQQTRLTAREAEVLRHIVDGKSTKEVAGILGISFKTAVCHRSNIMTKLAVPNAAAMVRRAILDGFVPPPQTCNR